MLATRARAAALAAVLCATAAGADVVDLTGGRSRRRGLHPAKLVLKADGGNAFAPYGLVGGALSYLTDSLFAFEIGAGGGFPGVQTGFALRKLFGERGSYLATELSIAGNTKQAKGSPAPGQLSNTGQHVWSSLGLGFEQRTAFFSASFIASIAFVPSDASAHFGLHGGLGFGF